MDPVSIIFKILPQLGKTVGIYKDVRSKFKIFCHYSAEIERIRKLFGAQRGCFLNEVELLLRLIGLDKTVIDDMMKDPKHGQWGAYRPSAELDALFGRNLPLLNDVIDDITLSIVALQSAFQCFLPLEEEKERDDNLKSKPLKDAMRKLRKRVQITIEKTSFEDKIADLEKLNYKLIRLRKQVNELQAPLCCAIKRSDRTRRLPVPVEFGAYGTIRRASKALHEALKAAWSDTEVPRLRHLVKLFLDAKADTEVQMEIAILCYDDVLQQRPLLETSLTRVQVRSRTMNSIAWSDASLLVPAPQMDGARSGQRKRQKVRFASVSDSSDIASQASPAASAVSIATSQSSAATQDNLQLTGHFCSEISKRCSTPDIICNKEGLGHIDSCMQEAFRHCFFPCPKNSDYNNMALDDVMRMDEALAQPAHNRLDIVSQLRLAHRLVSAVLKFNSTPWLNEVWNIGDLAFFRQGGDLTRSLQTLHFGVELSHSAPESEDSVMQVESPASLVHTSIEDAQYKHGVRNVTLFSLGAALLAIGRWECIDHSDIEGIRRLASQPSYLGPMYQELTQKVLDCDFGHGKDLKKPRLQEAVYEAVVLELESMIASLDISRD